MVSGQNDEFDPRDPGHHKQAINSIHHVGQEMYDNLSHIGVRGSVQINTAIVGKIVEHVLSLYCLFTYIYIYIHTYTECIHTAYSVIC